MLVTVDTVRRAFDFSSLQVYKVKSCVICCQSLYIIDNHDRPCVIKDVLEAR